MSFDPAFIFHRDGDAGDCDTLADMSIEAEAELATRQRRYPRLIRKGVMTSADADHELRVMAAIADNLAIGSTPQMPNESDAAYLDRLIIDQATRRTRERRGIATWTERVHALRREIGLRREVWPGLVEAGRIDGAEADRRLRVIESLHFMTWHFDWSDEALEARAMTGRRAAA